MENPRNIFIINIYKSFCLRITSYNVCYTKLLREEIDLFANVYREKLGLYVVKNNWQKTYSFSNSEAKAKAFIYVDDKDVPRILHVVKNDRITSYNVCYTKLLRFNAGQYFWRIRVFAKPI